MPATPASMFSKSVNFQFTLISAVFVLAFTTFYLGWGQMRYSSTTVIPIEKLVFWRFALAGHLPLLGYLATCLFAVRVLSGLTSGKTRSIKVISWIHLIVCGIALVWTLIFCAWEITAWTECNDPGPKHPECRNREYPAKTIADYSFIMMVISGAVMACVMGWALYFNSMVGISRMALSVEAEAEFDTIGGRYEKSEKKMKHHHGKRKHVRSSEPSLYDFRESQGNN